jgi:hypothetical protein
LLTGKPFSVWTPDQDHCADKQRRALGLRDYKRCSKNLHLMIVYEIIFNHGMPSDKTKVNLSMFSESGCGWPESLLPDGPAGRCAVQALHCARASPEAVATVIGLH